MTAIDVTSFERDAGVRFGFYLRPSFAMCRAQAELHELLRRQFGATTAGKFMPHATIKGFFRSDASIAEMTSALDPVIREHRPFTVVNNGPVGFNRRSVVLDIQHDETGATNPAIQRFHEETLAVLMPLVDPNCPNTPSERLGEHFHAHLTLAQSIPQPEFFDEIFEFLQDAEPIGPRRFTAEYFHLYAFRSDNWSGDLYETFRWTLLHSWKLGADSGE